MRKELLRAVFRNFFVVPSDAYIYATVLPVSANSSVRTWGGCSMSGSRLHRCKENRHSRWRITRRAFG